MQTLHTVKVHTPRLSDLMLEEQTPLGQYESHKAIRELNRFHQDPCNEKADRFLENSRKLRDAYAVKTEIEQKVKNLTQQNDDPDAEEETFEEKVLRLQRQKQELAALYARVDNEMHTNFDAICNEESVLENADSAIYEPDAFWPRVEIEHRAVQRDADLFFVCEEK